MHKEPSKIKMFFVYLFVWAIKGSVRALQEDIEEWNPKQKTFALFMILLIGVLMIVWVITTH